MKKSILLPGIVVVMMVINACSTTPHEINSEKMDSSWKGQPFKNVLIVGLYEDRPSRISGEVSFTDELKSKGVTASPSYDVFPDLNVLKDAAAVRKTAVSKGFDGILTVATTDVNEKYTYEDALETDGWVYLLGGKPGAATDTGVLISALSSGTFALHIALWDASSQKLVWQVTTDSVIQDSASDEIKSLADLVVQKLRAKGLI